MEHKTKRTALPTHVCPKCGEWWDVYRDGNGNFIVNWHYARTENDLNWMESTEKPFCPTPTCTTELVPWMIVEE